MKLLWHSTAPWGGSSYSVLTARVVPALVRDGHQVAVSTWYGLQGEPKTMLVRPRGEPDAKPIGAYTVLPNATEGDYGAGDLLGIYNKFKPDALITCMDIWVLPPALLRQMRVAAWMPVDHDPCPEGIAKSAAACAYPMSYSRWGVEVLKAAGVEAAYVPCSADASVFAPADKAEARAKLGIPGDCDFLVSMVAANKDPSDRKGFSEALQGFARFVHDGHPHARICLHTLWAGPISILGLVGRLGLQNNIAMPDQWDYAHGTFDDAHMATIYNASDVLLNTAKSEGFGLPLLEAQMCGTPVAATDFSTTDELLFAGWRIEGQPDWSYGADSFRLRAYVDSVAAALEEAYIERGNETLRKQARAGALAYDCVAVFDDYWRPALKEIESLTNCQPGEELKLVVF